MKTLVFGHKKPDTDSVCSAISYAFLKKQLGLDAEARILGDLNQETKFVLNKFNIPEPKYLNDVKIKVKNMKYLKNAYINKNLSIEDTFNQIQELNVTGLPLVDDNQNLVGYINLKDICKYMIHGDLYSLDTSYDNILNVLNAKSILKFDDKIKGTLLTAAYRSKTFTETVELTNDTILIVADREQILEYAINSKIKMIVLIGDFKVPAELLIKASKNKVNIISTPELTYTASSKIRLSNYVINACVQYDPICFKESDYRDEIIEIASKYNHTNYPIVDKNKHCVGMLRLVDQHNYEKRDVILVDHNQDTQSADGIEEANILEVVDHHNIGLFQSSSPISFRVMPVGCTATIIYQIYKENKIDIPSDIAGLMLSSIISDTLLFKSPTTTKLDEDTAQKLAKIVNIDIEKYGMEMFKAGTSIKGMDSKEILEQDFKTYKLDDGNIGISQVMTLNIDNIMDNKNEYVRLLNDMNSTYDYKVALMFVTDVIKDGSYIFYNESSKDIIETIYQIKELKQGLFLPNIVSRKKQMVPKIIDFYQKN